MQRRILGTVVVMALLAHSIVSVQASAAAPGGRLGLAAISFDGTFHALSPARILGTLDGNGAPRAKWAQVPPWTCRSRGGAGLPTTVVSAVVMNVTVTQPTAARHLTDWPAGSPLPVASNLNYVAARSRRSLHHGDDVGPGRDDGSRHTLNSVRAVHRTAHNLVGLAIFRLEMTSGVHSS